MNGTVSNIVKDLREKTIRGGFARVCAQIANLVLRVGSLMVLARLLNPQEFGLVGMVTAFTGVFDLLRDFGLSTASVQRATITEEQVSNLFWINILVGLILGVFVLALAPTIALFYHEPRLFWIASVLAIGFLFNAAGVQHSAMLQREMRFTALAIINVVALVVSSSLAISMAALGFGYRSLVVMTITIPLTTTVGLWLTTRWIPSLPKRQADIRSIMRFGGTITLNSLVVYIAYNLEKVLLGRFWGAETVGLYGRAFQLVTIPTSNLNTAVGEVAFSALSRVQHDSDRLKNYFMKGYSLVTGMTVPITLAGALFANDLVFVVLGPNWHGAATIFRLLTPTILIFAMINPLGWLLYSLGMVGRSLKIALVLAPIVITGYVIGLSHGPKGVAFAYSAVMTLWLIPHIAWCVHGTVISIWDILRAVTRPLLSGALATVLALGAQVTYGPFLSPLTRLLLGGAVLLSAYLGILLYVMGQKDLYFQLLLGLRKRTSVKETALVSA